jgi:hypothetical protein
MMNNIIETTILNGKFKGEDVVLPHIPMIPTDMPFEFLCESLLQRPSTKQKDIATSEWTKFDASHMDN